MKQYIRFNLIVKHRGLVKLLMYTIFPFGMNNRSRRLFLCPDSGPAGARNLSQRSSMSEFTRWVGFSKTFSFPDLEVATTPSLLK